MLCEFIYYYVALINFVIINYICFEVNYEKIFNEDTRVKILATIQFLRLGYNYQSLKNDDVDIDFNTKIFVNRFKPSLEKINGRALTYDKIKSILEF